MISLEAPYFLILLLAPFAVYFLLPPFKEKEMALKISTFGIYKKVMQDRVMRGEIQQRDRLRKVLIIIAWLLFCLALARPVQHGHEIVKEESTKSFYLGLDISGSMNHIETGGKSRLHIAKDILNQFIKQRSKDNLGLIVFGDAPYLQAPLTKDTSVVTDLVNEIQVGMAGLSTHLGDAIGLGIKMFEESKVEEKVLILLTDGNDTGSLIVPREAALIAKERGIKVHTIGFGDPSTVGENPIDVEVLKQISDVTGGKYYLPKGEAELAQAFKEINKIEESKITKTSYTPKYELYYYLIIITIIMYLLYLTVVNLRRLRFRGVKRG